MKIEIRRNKSYFLYGNTTIPLGVALPKINHIFRNYDSLLKDRNKLEAQLERANRNIEILLRELRKFDSPRYPQSSQKEEIKMV